MIPSEVPLLSVQGAPLAKAARPGGVADGGREAPDFDLMMGRAGDANPNADGAPDSADPVEAALAGLAALAAVPSFARPPSVPPAISGPVATTPDFTYVAPEKATFLPAAPLLTGREAQAVPGPRVMPRAESDTELSADRPRQQQAAARDIDIGLPPTVWGLADVAPKAGPTPEVGRRDAAATDISNPPPAAISPETSAAEHRRMASAMPGPSSAAPQAIDIAPLNALPAKAMPLQALPGRDISGPDPTRWPAAIAQDLSPGDTTSPKNVDASPIASRSDGRLSAGAPVPKVYPQDVVGMEIQPTTNAAAAPVLPVKTDMIAIVAPSAAESVARDISATASIVAAGAAAPVALEAKAKGDLAPWRPAAVATMPAVSFPVVQAPTSQATPVQVVESMVLPPAATVLAAQSAPFAAVGGGAEPSATRPLSITARFGGEASKYRQPPGETGAMPLLQRPVDLLKGDVPQSIPVQKADIREPDADQLPGSALAAASQGPGPTANGVAAPLADTGAMTASAAPLATSPGSVSPHSGAVPVAGGDPSQSSVRDPATGPSHSHTPPERQIVEALHSHRGGRVELSLSPEELGRVTLTLETRGENLALSVQADRPETLDLLRRNLPDLARELRDIGYGALSFSFSGQDPQGQQQRLAQDMRSSGFFDDDLIQPSNPTLGAMPHRTGGGVDIRL